VAFYAKAMVIRYNKSKTSSSVSKAAASAAASALVPPPQISQAAWAQIMEWLCPCLPLPQRRFGARAEASG
jgi:hypothetical protein